MASEFCDDLPSTPGPTRDQVYGGHCLGFGPEPDKCKPLLLTRDPISRDEAVYHPPGSAKHCLQLDL